MSKSIYNFSSSKLCSHSRQTVGGVVQIPHALASVATNGVGGLERLKFASSQIDYGGTELSMDELYCLWRAKNPTPAELAESLDALRAAYAELESGDNGRPAREALRETCERLGLVLDE